MFKALAQKFNSRSRLLKERRGFSITEVVVAAIIFSLAAAGMYATIVSFNKPAATFSEASQAAFIGKQVLESLRPSINQESWDSVNSLVNPLSLGTHNWTAVTVDGISYNGNYLVESDTTTSGRKVTLNIYWTD